MARLFCARQGEGKFEILPLYRKGVKQFLLMQTTEL